MLSSFKMMDQHKSVGFKDRKRKLAREIRRSQPHPTHAKSWVSCRWEALKGLDRKKTECVYTYYVYILYASTNVGLHVYAYL